MPFWKDVGRGWRILGCGVWRVADGPIGVVGVLLSRL